MLAKRYRLRKNIEFVATYAQKKYVSNKYLTLNLGKPKPHNDFISKVAFVVSKKVDKRAVVRNKIKRRMREAYKILIKDNPNYQKWISLIFSSKTEFINADFETVKAQMKHALEKAIAKYD
ncbi:MAG: ribonuclease P protein component [Candidatus Gastranaerophilales bacterium]|nr:ribonuclease P protein component [Candidatus Gastranaerophilales bacterium]